jgi:hypothetical protein
MSTAAPLPPPLADLGVIEYAIGGTRHFADLYLVRGFSMLEFKFKTQI